MTLHFKIDACFFCQKDGSEWLSSTLSYPSFILNKFKFQSRMHRYKKGCTVSIKSSGAKTKWFWSFQKSKSKPKTQNNHTLTKTGHRSVRYYRWSIFALPRKDNVLFWFFLTKPEWITSIKPFPQPSQNNSLP